MPESKPTPVPVCSFCGKPRAEVSFMVKGIDAYICEDCVELCREKLRHHHTKNDGVFGRGELPTPSKIKGALDDYVVGQEHIKKMLSVAVYNHYKRQKYKDTSRSDVDLGKANILLIGATGSGKTLFARTLAKILDVPLAIVDATTLTEAGYVGEDVENIIQRLMQRCDYDLEQVVRGIIYIDEIDKIARKTENPSITRDVSGEGVQQALLKIIEGTIAAVPPQGGRKHPHQEYVQIDTTEILFICGGAFESMDHIIARRQKDAVVGFNNAPANEQPLSSREVLPEDLIAHGLIPELVGRLPIIGRLHNLTDKNLISIFTSPRDALAKQYGEIFHMEGVSLSFTDEAIAAIVDLAKKRGSGARGLRAITEDFLMEIMFTLPDMKSVTGVIIDADAIKSRRPLLVMRNGTRKRMPLKSAA